MVPMALNVKDDVLLAGQVARMTGESKTRAIRIALEERLARLREAETPEERKARLMGFLEEEIWPVFEGERMPTQDEQDEILGYGEHGFGGH
jgi:antitoxin VapB